mgnify:CR=1 FL=1
MKPEVSVQQGDDFMRYEIGDFVSKPVTGVCRIEDILYLDAQGKKDNKLYYRMHPDRRECVEIDRKDPRNFDAMDGEREDAGAEV